VLGSRHVGRDLFSKGDEFNLVWVPPLGDVGPLGLNFQIFPKKNVCLIVSGLIAAVQLELPKIEHRMCVQHIYGNSKKIYVEVSIGLSKAQWSCPLGPSSFMGFYGWSLMDMV